MSLRNAHTCPNRLCRRRHSFAARYCGRCGARLPKPSTRRRAALAVSLVAGLCAALLAPIAAMLAISPPAAPYEPPGLSAAQSPDPTEAPPDAASAPAVIASSTEALPPAPMTLSQAMDPADPIAESTRTAAVQAPPVHWPTIAASPGAGAALSARIEAAFAPLEGIRSFPAGGVKPAVEYSAMPSMRTAEVQADAILRRVDRIRAEVRSRALTPGGDWPANSRRW